MLLSVTQNINKKNALERRIEKPLCCKTEQQQTKLDYRKQDQKKRISSGGEYSEGHPITSL